MEWICLPSAFLLAEELLVSVDWVTRSHGFWLMHAYGKFTKRKSFMHFSWQSGAPCSPPGVCCSKGTTASFSHPWRSCQNYDGTLTNSSISSIRPCFLPTLANSRVALSTSRAPWVVGDQDGCDTSGKKAFEKKSNNSTGFSLCIRGNKYDDTNGHFFLGRSTHGRRCSCTLSLSPRNAFRLMNSEYRHNPPQSFRIQAFSGKQCYTQDTKNHQRRWTNRQWYLWGARNHNPFSIQPNKNLSRLTLHEQCARSKEKREFAFSPLSPWQQFGVIWTLSFEGR